MKTDEELKQIANKYNLGSGTSTPTNTTLRGKALTSSLGSSTVNNQSQKQPNFIDKAGEVGTQGGRSIWRTAQTLSGVGEKILQAPMKLFGAKFDDKSSAEMLLPKDLTRKGETSSENTGEFIGEAIQYLTPAGTEKLVSKGATILSKVLSNAPKYAKSLSNLGLKSVVGGTEFAGKTALMGGEKEDVKTAGTIGLLTPPAVKVASKATSFAFKDLFPVIAGTMTGIDPKTIKAIFKNPEAVAKYMSEKVVPIDVRNKAISALDKYKARIGQTFEKGLEDMRKLSPRLKQARTEGGKGFPGVFSGVKGEFKNIMETGENTLKGTLNNFRVSIQGNKLDFDKLNSSIISPTERKQIQAVWDTIRNQKDFSVKGVQDVASRIGALAKFTDGPATRSSAIIGKMLNVYKKAIKEVYPKLRELRNQYEVDKKIIKGLEDIIKSSKGEVTNPTTATSVAKRLTKLFNEDNEAYVRALRRLEEETGEDLIEQFIAANFDQLLPSSVGSKLAIAGGIVYNPLIFAILPLFSPKIVGRMAVGIGKASKLGQKINPLLPNILK